MADESVDIDLYAGVEDFSGTDIDIFLEPLDEKVDPAENDSNTPHDDSYPRRLSSEPIKPPINLINSISDSNSHSHHYSDKLDCPLTSHLEDPIKKSRLSDYADDTNFDSPPIPKNNISVYISNMTWWTNDIELTNIIVNIGVTDLVDIKFYDNRNNGQSKGYAMVVVKSKESSVKLFDAIPKLIVNGNQLHISMGNRHNLHALELSNRKASGHDAAASANKESGSVISSTNYETRTTNNRSHGANSSSNNYNRNSGFNCCI